MSLESKIEELTRAVIVLTEVMGGGGKATVNGQPNKSSKTPAKAEEADSDEEGGKQFLAGVQEKTKAAKPAAPAKTVAKAAAPKGDAYAPVKKAILDAIAAGHRKSISDMLAEYDAKTGQDLSPDVYPEVLEKIAAVVGGEVEELA